MSDLLWLGSALMIAAALSGVIYFYLETLE
jgi:hypothetical protein